MPLPTRACRSACEHKIYRNNYGQTAGRYRDASQQTTPQTTDSQPEYHLNIKRDVLHNIDVAHLRGSTPSKVKMLCSNRKALPKRHARNMVALREAAVAVGGQGGSRVPATALSSRCLMLANKSCRYSTCAPSQSKTTALSGCLLAHHSHAECETSTDHAIVHTSVCYPNKQPNCAQQQGDQHRCDRHHAKAEPADAQEWPNAVEHTCSLGSSGGTYMSRSSSMALAAAVLRRLWGFQACCKPWAARGRTS